MAKIIIPFNNKEYSVDESAFAAASAALKSHLSTIMNGSGATISFGGTDYNIDSAKLSAATNDFITHLGTVAGSGKKVVIGGVEYNVDSAKMNSAIAELETVLGDLHTGNDGDDSGNEYNPNDPALNPVGTIPEGAYYGNLLTGTFYDTTMPATVSEGDVFLYGDYMYKYDTRYYSGWAAVLATEELGIGAYLPNYPLTNRFKSSYGTILTSINGVNVTEINELTYSDCINLVSVIIPNSITTIDMQTFIDCKSLESINIPASVTHIYNDAFNNCTSLTTITFGGTTAEWDVIVNALNGSAFSSLIPATTVVCSDGEAPFPKNPAD